MKIKERFLWGVVFTLLCAFLLWILAPLKPPPLPTDETPLLLYSTDLKEDLRDIHAAAIKSAQKSILMEIYALRDPALIRALNEKGEKGLDVSIIADHRASAGLRRYLHPSIRFTPKKGAGLMHRKILIIDNRDLWIGSANYTTDSLRFHSNLTAGIRSPLLAEQIINKSTGRSSIWLLPDPVEGPEKIRQTLRSAQKTVRVAMFTFTRQDFAKEIVGVSQRGVDVEVVIDRNSAKGVGKRVVDLLREGGVPVYLSRGPHLLHHKCAIIDGKTLVHGSANWTLQAFSKNEDCFMVLDLQEEQAKKLERMWKRIRKRAVAVE